MKVSYASILARNSPLHGHRGDLSMIPEGSQPAEVKRGRFVGSFTIPIGRCADDRKEEKLGIMAKCRKASTFDQTM